MVCHCKEKNCVRAIVTVEDSLFAMVHGERGGGCAVARPDGEAHRESDAVEPVERDSAEEVRARV